MTHSMPFKSTCTPEDFGTAASGMQLDVHDRLALRPFGNRAGWPFEVIEDLPVQDSIPLTPLAQIRLGSFYFFTMVTFLGFRS